jgi:hypothetical protein
MRIGDTQHIAWLTADIYEKIAISFASQRDCFRVQAVVFEKSLRRSPGLDRLRRIAERYGGCIDRQIGIRLRNQYAAPR